MLGVEAFSEVVEQVGAHLGDGPALLAQKMVMRTVGHVIDRRAGAELHTFDHGEVDEQVERAVHGADVELGLTLAHGGDDLGPR